MTTATRSTPFLEVTAASDVMDLHSDSGLDFGDGDIELDMHSTGAPDDDVSLQDAGIDLGLDVQTVSADQDDFMADQEDLIEDDLVIYDDAVIDEPNQQPNNTPGSAQQAPVGIEDDLIDYSDDEREPIPDDEGSTSNPVDTHVENDPPTEGDVTGQTVVEFDEVIDASAVEPIKVQSANQDAEEEKKEDPVRGDQVQPQEQEWHAQSPSANFDDSQSHHSPYEATHQEPEEELHADATVTSHVAQPSEISQGDDAHHDQVYLHQVTVNYNDAELWLFKRHDLDASGDYLLDDDLPLKQPMSSLLDACRTAFGSSLSVEMELGLRLDSFNNIELWQEHSSCAFVSLEHLISLYLQLHTQDGTSDPESFYMTLLFRPRVSTLISEIQKAVADGIGHSRFHQAIDAGETAFSTHSGHDPTEHHSVWDEAERQQEGELQDSSGLDVEGEHDGNYDDEENEKVFEADHEEYEEEAYEEPEEANDPEEVSESHTQSFNGANVPSRTGSTSDASGGSTRQPARGNDEPAPQTANLSPSNSQASPLAEEDLLDYSDDEDASASHVDPDVARQPSSSSSTVQGDAKSYANGDTQDQAASEDYTEASVDATYEPQEDEASEAFAQNETLDLGTGFNDQDYGEQHNEENEQADEDSSVNVQDFEEYRTEYAPQANDEITNQYDDNDAEDQNVDSLADLVSAPVGDMGKNDAESNGLVDDITGADDFLYLDTVDTAADDSTQDQGLGIIEQDVVDFDDNGDGEDGEAPVAAPVAASPVVSSSSELQDLSPPGQKRKIDEASNDGGEATSTTDAKRPRV